MNLKKVDIHDAVRETYERASFSDINDVMRVCNEVYVNDDEGALYFKIPKVEPTWRLLVNFLYLSPDEQSIETIDDVKYIRVWWD